MPYGWIAPDILLEHCGVIVYFVYKNDDISQGRRLFLYTTDPLGGDCDDPFSFDVINLSTYSSNKKHEQIIREAIDKGEIIACSE